MSDYRFSIIPAGAVTDRSLEPRDLQVLCLLGRHTDKQGWCYRSQVKMASEIACGRATVQRSLDRLYDAGWVEKRLRSTTGELPSEDRQPHTAHAYRVIIDRDDIPVSEAISDNATSSPADGGCPPAGTPDLPVDGHGGARPSTGTGCPRMHGHQENVPLEQTQDEPLRESARARRAEGLALFEARWPTAAGDDRNRMQFAWEALSEQERDDALGSIGAFLEHLKSLKRKHIPAGWNYLEQRKWALLKRDDPQSAKPQLLVIDVESPEGRAWAAIHRVGRAPEPLQRSAKFWLSRPLTPAEMAFADLPPIDEWQVIDMVDDRNRAGAWNSFFATALAGRVRRPLFDVEFRAPWPWPPKKDGSLVRVASQEDETEFANATGA